MNISLTSSSSDKPPESPEEKAGREPERLGRRESHCSEEAVGACGELEAEARAACRDAPECALMDGLTEHGLREYVAPEQGTDRPQGTAEAARAAAVRWCVAYGRSPPTSRSMLSPLEDGNDEWLLLMFCVSMVLYDMGWPG
ncbi:hypothetical protein EYF80_042193 [Liparis tanakae]|uniref:Uncharacterized protein n=1 Tax=Liparis tanakae TaxID=230148 RepID=A0A4Z2G370_9TELE|nr:hypothetical protein EYF80_042193 [Liparis tanakae]